MDDQKQQSEKSKDQLTSDQKAAHQFLSELRTRITTQPLPYQHGVEQTALESLYAVFGHAREAMKAHPGCEEFAREVTEMLNMTLRPFTEKWHRASDAGVLLTRDGGDDFRCELAIVQGKLRKFARTTLSLRAYGKEGEDPLSPAIWEDHPAELKALLRPLAAGIPSSSVQLNQGVGEAIFESEKKDIKKRRDLVEKESSIPRSGPKTGGEVKPGDEINNAVGLALSGGGIRSATFSLGVIQTFATKNMMKDVDYLSTVSGGGYIGSFISQTVGHPEKCAVTKEKEASSKFSHEERWARMGAPNGADSEPVRYLRLRARFLSAHSFLDRISMIISTLLGMVLNWIVPMSIIMGAALIVHWVTGVSTNSYWYCFVTLFPKCLAAALVIAIFAYLVTLRRSVRGTKILGIWVLPILTVLLGFVAILFAIDQLYDWIFRGVTFESYANLVDAFKKSALNEFFADNRIGQWLGGLGLSVSVIAAMIPAVLAFMPLLKGEKIKRWLGAAGLSAAGVIVPFIGLCLFIYFRAVSEVDKIGFWNLSGDSFLLCVLTFLIVLALVCLNINLTGPHRLYRNRLSKTFVERDDSQDVKFPLKDLNGTGYAPYHILNATVNLPSSKDSAIRDRRADFFIFSKYWMGSPLTEYKPTRGSEVNGKNQGDEWKHNNHPADLASALAISGAAFSSHMGLKSQTPVRALLSFINIRLGFWIRRPHVPGLWGLTKWQHPGFFCLLREMFGFGMDEKKAWLNLSDGGHIENLAVYELLRRRCKFIICIDGEADPDFTFHGLMTLTRHAQIDFGIKIDSDLADIRPDPETKLSRSHYRFCRVHYPTQPGKQKEYGFLLYIKLSATGDESELIQRYRKNNPSFPHQSTIDQFFDQEQFEAYRQLGAHAAEGLFADCLLSHQRPANVEEWFHLLVLNLLEPEGE